MLKRGRVQCLVFLFFFQAEDGIRDLTVTGVQTCALPICAPGPRRTGARPAAERDRGGALPAPQPLLPGPAQLPPEAGGADQRSDRPRRRCGCPTDRPVLRGVPDVRVGPAEAAGGAAGVALSRPAVAQPSPAVGQRSGDRAARRRGAAARAGAAIGAAMIRVGVAALACALGPLTRAVAQRPPPTPPRSFHERYAELVANPRRLSDSARLLELV